MSALQRPGRHPVFTVIDAADCLRLDRDTTLTFDVHVIQNLVLHLTAGEDSGLFNDPVRQCRLAVVDVSDNTKVPYLINIESCQGNSS